jgi:hypothetical protein
MRGPVQTVEQVFTEFSLSPLLQIGADRDTRTSTLMSSLELKGRNSPS